MDISTLTIIAAGFIFWRTNRHLRQTINRQREQLACWNSSIPGTTAKIHKRKRGHKAGKRLKQRAANRRQTSMHEYLNQNAATSSPCKNCRTQKQNQSCKKFEWTDDMWRYDEHSTYLPPSKSDAAWKAVLWCCVEIAREEKSTVIKKQAVDLKLFQEFGLILKKHHNEPQRKCRIKGLIKFPQPLNGMWMIEPFGFQTAIALFAGSRT